MPREPRLLLSQTYYHVMTRGNNKKTIFHEDSDYNYYLQLMDKYKREHAFDLYHYCLMPNHTHFLVKTNKASDFSTFMKKLNLSYYYYYKKHYSWFGHFFQGRFKSQPVGKDEYFIQCGKYIELNPVRARLVQYPQDYSFSSFRYYAQGERNHLITKDLFYESLGKTEKDQQKNYQELVIGDEVLGQYNKRIWASPEQRYNEARKIRYNLR